MYLGTDYEFSNEISTPPAITIKSNIGFISLV